MSAMHLFAFSAQISLILRIIMSGFEHKIQLSLAFLLKQREVKRKAPTF